MPPLDWLAFAQLPGAATRNWELLCRELVRRSYGRFGQLRSVAQQPGVEFHLELHEACDLGEPGRWWGWQCRWYELSAGTQIGRRRQDKIIDSIRKSEAVLPSLTDWVLWTVRPLTPSDQKWFEEIDTRLRLHLWTADNVEGLLVGDSAVLRETYFGELILDAHRLERVHELSVAQLRGRWDPIAHVEVAVEAELNRILGDPIHWAELIQLVERLERRSAELAEDLSAVSTDARSAGDVLSDDLENLRTWSATVAEALASGRLADARMATTAASRRADPVAVRRGARECRARNHPAALTLIAGLEELDAADELLERIDRYLAIQVVAVIGDAGRGKTYLAAELTKPSNSRPSGVLLRGRDLGSRGSLDDLASRVPGVEVSSFERLVAAVDAAGSRFGKRLPVVIDGLNEAENPRDWRDLIAPLPALLRDYPNVLIVVTLRASVADDALPKETPSIELRGFEGIEREAAARYFDYYRIDPRDAHLPLARFGNPLFLRLFCETTNPQRAEVVGIESIPSSLDAVFASYRDAAVDRVASELRLNPDDIRTVLTAIAGSLWEKKARSLSFEELRQIAGDDERDWDHSIARALEDEGVLLREGGADDQRSEWLFDAFAGFMLADALVQTHGPELPAFLAQPDVAQLLEIGQETAHPLAKDTVAGLAGALPRRFGVQFWPMTTGPARAEALRTAAELELDLIDGETVDAFAEFIRRPPDRGIDPLMRLKETRAASGHPLNAEYLDKVLRSFDVADRDLRWTEWIRHNAAGLDRDLEAIEASWTHATALDERDRLLGLWVSWCLTSTSRPLRDRATRSLFLFGRIDPARLFELILRQLDVDDPYIIERLLASAYGVFMANQLPSEAFRAAGREFLEALRERLLTERAMPLSHWLARQYVRGMFSAAARLYPELLPDDHSTHDMKFVEGDAPSAIKVDKRGDHEVTGAFHMDFENYTVGRLVADRGNYQWDHAEYQEVLSSVRGRVWELGWREASFGDVDHAIAREERSDLDRGGKTERYGKKYSWIGYYEEAGRLEDAGKFDTEESRTWRLPDVDIDPSFPLPPDLLPMRINSWIATVPSSDAEWVAAGAVDVPDRLLRPTELDEHAGPWLLAYGFLQERDENLGRDVFGFVRLVLVPQQFTERIIDLLSTTPYLGNDFIPREATSYYTFAGEIPWSERFSPDSFEEHGYPLYKEALRTPGDESMAVEILSHGFAWEGYHCVLNQAGNPSVPAATFSRQFQLRGRAQRFDQTEADKSLAALSFNAPVGFEGHLLFLREDLVRAYAASTGSDVVLIAWGERGVALGAAADVPPWLRDHYATHANLWRRVVTLEDLG